MNETRLSDAANSEPEAASGVAATQRLWAVPVWAGVLLLIMLAGFGLRVYDLDGQSMWSDEGLSLYRARQTLANVQANIITVDGIDTQDTNPSFYFLLLHLWRTAVSETIFSLRYSGVLAGLLAIPLMAVWGQATFGRRVGVVAGLLMAVSPFHIWQSQELRNYSLLLTLNLFSVYGLFRFALYPAGRLRWRWLVLWATSGLLGIYTHYFGFFVMAYGLACLMIVGWQQGGIRRFWRQQWLWLGIAVTLLMLPVAAVALNRFLAGRQVDFYAVPLADVVATGLSAFSVGITPYLIHPTWRVAPVVALALVGLSIAWSRHRLATGLLLGYQLVPLGFMLLFSLVNPLYNGTRHLLIGLPPFLLFTAVGIVGLWPQAHAARWQRWAGWLLLLWGALILCGQLVWLRTQFNAPELIRDDVRGVARYLSEVAASSDVVVLHDTLIGFTFDYYYDGAAPVTAVPLYGEMDTAAAEAALAAASAGASRLWFVSEPSPRTGFPREHLAEWVRAEWPRFWQHTYPSMWLTVKLEGFVPAPTLTTLPDTAVPLDVQWQDGLHLHGIEMTEAVNGEPEADSGVAATQRLRVVPASSEWWPTLYWSRGPETAERYMLSWRFIDPSGQVWALANEPLWPDNPPLYWPDETLIRAPHLMQIPAGLPPGAYQVWLRLLAWDTLTPLHTDAGETDILLIPSLVVQSNTAVSPVQLPPHTPHQLHWPGLDMVGYTLEGGPYRPGHNMPIELYWQVRGAVDEVELIAQLVDKTGNLVAEIVTTPTRSDYSSSQWQPGELLHGRAEITVPARAASGEYSVRLALRDKATGNWLRVRDGWRFWDTARSGFRFARSGFRFAVSLPDTVTIEAWPLQTELPPIAIPVAAQFGEPVVAELKGYELTDTDTSATLSAGAPTGDTLDITLLWQAQAETDTNYRVFLHLMGSDGQIVAQHDDFPVRGARQTTGWRVGEVVSDTHTMLIPADLPSGEYALWVGLYDLDTGQRLPITVEGVVQADGRLLLTKLALAD